MQMRWRYLQRQTCFEITIKKEVSEVEEWEDVIHVQNKFQVLILLEDIRCNKKRKSTAKTSLFFTRCLWRFIHSSPFIVLHDSSSFMFSVLLLYIRLESKEDHREDKNVKTFLVKKNAITMKEIFVLKELVMPLLGFLCLTRQQPLPTPLDYYYEDWYSLQIVLWNKCSQRNKAHLLLQTKPPSDPVFREKK